MLTNFATIEISVLPAAAKQRTREIHHISEMNLCVCTCDECFLFCFVFFNNFHAKICTLIELNIYIPADFVLNWIVYYWTIYFCFNSYLCIVYVWKKHAHTKKLMLDIKHIHCACDKLREGNQIHSTTFTSLKLKLMCIIYDSWMYGILFQFEIDLTEFV